MVSVREIEAGIPAILEGARLPGLQIAVINDGQAVYTGGFDVKSTESGEKVDTGETGASGQIGFSCPRLPEPPWRRRPS